MSKHDIWPWWGGKDRTAQEVANLPDLYRFRLQRHGYYENVDFATVQDLLVQLSRKVRLGIFDGACSVGEIQPEEPGRARNHGVTTRSNDDPEDLIRLYVSWQRIASLMREDLTTSMRLAEQFVLALTILHEIGVSTLPNLSIMLEVNHTNPGNFSTAYATGNSLALTT